MSLAERKLVELDAKLAGIDEELAPWLADTLDGRPLRKHRTQLLRITDTLRGLVDRMTAERAALPQDGADVLDGCRRIQDGILEVYRVWEFFRSKFALRYHGNYREFLAVADEFAWACYRPALDLAVVTDRPKRIGVEPPLVYFSGDFSPFVHPRGERFEVEETGRDQESEEFFAVLMSLPVPVVGLPWYQLNHLPDLLLLAHEVGHCVEADFGLGPTTGRRLGATGIPPERLTRWRRWSSELFADCFATVVAGPAYAGALADFLAFGPDEEAGTTHPPARLRIAVAARLLDRTGFAAQARDVRASWPGDPTGPFADDVDTIADALTSASYPQLRDRTVLDLGRFTPARQADAASAAKSSLSRQLPGTADVRALLAGARIAFAASPDRAAESGRLILRRAMQTVDDGTRHADRHTALTTAADRAAGAALFDLVTDHTGAHR